MASEAHRLASALPDTALLHNPDQGLGHVRSGMQAVMYVRTMRMGVV